VHVKGDRALSHAKGSGRGLKIGLQPYAAQGFNAVRRSRSAAVRQPRRRNQAPKSAG
jgi:hypothetical protein